MNGKGMIGDPLTRVDGPLKVMGRATYAAEFEVPGVAYGVMVRSTIPSGTIASIDSTVARRMPGVLLVMTHENAPRLPAKGRAAVKPPAGREMSLLQDAAVRYNGEPIAVVVAATLEQATDAAAHLDIRYRAADAVLDFDQAKKDPKPAKMLRGPAEKKWGDAQSALERADVKVDAVYTTPMEHHNPMEPHGTIAEWKGSELTLYDATQYVSGAKETVAKTLGIPPEKVRVVCPFVGGGFGCKGSAWSHVTLAAMAARKAGRPVKLVLERPQMYGPVGGRPQTEQHIVLGAMRDGRIVALRHEVLSHTSVFEDFTEPSTQPTRALYAWPNGDTVQKLAKMNVGTPTFQRAPGEATGTFAIESAIDELAYELGMDPLELRLRNHADVEPSSGKPWSSKKLRECYEDGARRFGWSRRSARPGSMRDGRWLVGWGVATATYPAHRMEAKAVAIMNADGTFTVRSGTQDLGTGTYTICSQIAAETLGVPVQKVRFELGDTRFPKAPVSGGSMTAASVGPAVRAACLALREKIDAGGKAPLQAEGSAKPPAEDEEKKTHAERSFGALFGEVRVDPELGILRVPRVVATYSVGRILNAKTAASQFQGGIVWGLGMALMEESILDRRTGRIVNANLAEYHVPVNADIGSIEVAWVDENDTGFNDIGARGIGEIGITGVAGMVANAVFHATGKRVRSLPITLDKLL
ncbi:MAG TPA: xanthine dehydrogenase family protein molybdopterin-binding subunit [Usitatibacter sp.]|jgi:xanthine dehydrogenase YagR molybdenum-binding subunit|nr:xanthine dehydrogenase family protein molybdopterin-binding subunit [Usitatibacter sp.]